MWTTLRAKKSMGTSHRGLPQNCEIYLQEFDQILTVNIKEKSLWAFLVWGGSGGGG